MNLGEKNEYLLKFALILLRDSGNTKIKDVGFGNESYGSLPVDFKLQNLHLLNEQQQIKSLAASVGISKAPSSAKSDVYVDGMGYSVKYANAAPPAIVNHTHRHGILKVCNKLGLNISAIDAMVDQYWKLRNVGIIAEDVSNSSSNSPFRIKDPNLVKLVEYFIFEGTASSRSNYPAQMVLEFTDPANLETWFLYDRSQIIDHIWDKLVFSIRSKGMPKSYDHGGMGSRDLQIQKWTHYKDGKYKGALHIRIKQ